MRPRCAWLAPKRVHAVASRMRGIWSQPCRGGQLPVGSVGFPRRDYSVRGLLPKANGMRRRSLRDGHGRTRCQPAQAAGSLTRLPQHNLLYGSEIWPAPGLARRIAIGVPRFKLPRFPESFPPFDVSFNPNASFQKGHIVSSQVLLVDDEQNVLSLCVAVCAEGSIWKLPKEGQLPWR